MAKLLKKLGKWPFQGHFLTSSSHGCKLWRTIHKGFLYLFFVFLHQPQCPKNLANCLQFWQNFDLSPPLKFKRPIWMVPNLYILCRCTFELGNKFSRLSQYFFSSSVLRMFICVVQYRNTIKSFSDFWQHFSCLLDKNSNFCGQTKTGQKVAARWAALAVLSCC